MSGSRMLRLRSLRVAGPMISLGLLVQASTLFFTGPGPFLTFLMAGSGLVGVGVFLVIWTLRAGDRPGPK